MYYITNKEDFTQLIYIFNGNLCSLHRNEQFRRWLKTFNSQYKADIKLINRKVKPSLTTGWLSGFIDAEGHLGGRIKYCRTSKLKKAPHLSFTIAQKELYNLTFIRDLFVKNNKCISFDKSWEGWRLHIASFKSLVLVINYLKEFEFKT